MILQFLLFETKDDEISGYNLGHINIGNEEKLVSSKNRRPDQSMMIFISIVSFLDGLRSFLTTNKDSFKFVGTDSSFSINFLKRKKSTVRVKVASEFEELITEADLIKCVYDACYKFYRRYEKKLSDSDPVKEDIAAALTEFRKLRTM